MYATSTAAAAPRPVRVTNRTADQVIDARRPFTTANGTMSGTWNSFGQGMLPREYRAALDAAQAAGDTYVVKSYATPIAWWSEATGWVVPPVKYSVTTSKHQGKLPLV